MEKIILTEKRNPNTLNIDLLSSREIVELINNEDKKVAEAVNKELNNIAKAVDIIAESFLQGGSLLYFGAGTSGRLGILDASECPPTFGAPSSMVRGYIAGGDTAIKTAVEGAEDNFEQGQKDLIDAQATSNDVVVVISASGNAKYLLGVAQKAKELNIKTIAVVCNKNAKLKDITDITIAPEVGEEALTGSTRMKSGTAQKMVLNILTTSSMIKIGKTYENLMIDVQPTNEKLKDRAARIVSEIASCEYDRAKELLETNNYNVKACVVMIKKKCSFDEAQKILAEHNGVLRRALNEI